MQLWRGPAVGDHAAVEHVLQRPGSSAGGVLLIAGGNKGRAHDWARAASIGTTLPERGETMDGSGDVTTVGGKRRTIGCQHGGCRRTAQPGIQWCRTDNNPGIEQIIRIEEALELRHGLEGFVAVHGGEQLGPGPTVTVLAGRGTAVTCGAVGRLLDRKSTR